MHLVGVTVSMRVISAGDGYRYLLRSVAAGDGNRASSTPLTRYYAESGTPPGVWLGAGVAGLGDGQARLRVGEVVTEKQLEMLLGQGCDPVSGDALGRAYPVFRSLEERVRSRIEALDPGLSADERAESMAAVRADEAKRGTRRTVAGYDYTFSAPKSVSALWAVADAATQARIAEAHHGAVADVLAMLECDVAATRAGITGPEGAVAQVDVTGVVATAFDHYDSRAGDPQLHTHVVISNKVQTVVVDGRWRALDGRPMHAATVALSEHYNALLADHLTRGLGVGWEQRGRGRDRNPGWEIIGVPDELLEAFSSRSRDIETVKDRLISRYVQQYGRRPSPTTIIKLRAQATLATRPDKQIRSLAELTDDWRSRASQVLGQDATGWAGRVVGARHGGTADVAPVRAGEMSTEDVAAVAKKVVAAVGERRATWRRWNLHAEASRQTMGVRFATTADRDTVANAIVEAAKAGSVRLSPPEAAATPAEFRRTDGTSVFRPKHASVFTSAELLAAEDRLLRLGRTHAAPSIPVRTAHRVLARRRVRLLLANDQRAAVVTVVTSRRVVEVFVGPAGAGKTTTMRALRLLWERDYGPGSVVGLAPSAAAAQVLAADLGVATENTAKWLWEHARGRWNLRPGQLVILDEASLAGTFALDTLTSHAARVGAKVLLVGDSHQLDAVDAGGAFAMLISDRHRAGDRVAELSQVRRFTHDWEKDASLRLRAGEVEVIDTYAGHGRIREGETDAMTDAVYHAWQTDIGTGRSAIMIAESHEVVTTLNTRARADRIATARVEPTRAVGLHDGAEASAGDLVVTRRNERRLHAGRSWVKNGDRWRITRVGRDGSVRARRLGANGRYGGSVVLPANYVAQHVDLGYACTIHRAQGATVDTAHVFVASSSMSREAIYVAMTRGRQTNIAYVATDRPDLEAHQQPVDDAITARSVLHGVLKHVGAEQSAHQTVEQERDRWTSIGQLAAEYDTIAAAAQKPRWTRLLAHAGLTDQQIADVAASDAYGPLAALLRRAEADGHDPAGLLTRAIASHDFDGVRDLAAILHSRLSTATEQRPAGARSGKRPPARLIAGLIPGATGAMPDDVHQALSERARLIETRANTLLDEAITDRAPWLRTLGTPPTRSQPMRHEWDRAARTVAAYRDRYQITGNRPLGATADGVPNTDARRATRELQRAQRAANADRTELHMATAQTNRRSGPSL